MSEPRRSLHKLAERVLGKGGDVPLAMLLEHLAPVDQLRALARKLGLTPKGGFRIERAPAHVLAPLLAEQRDAEHVEEILQLLVPRPAPSSATATATPDAELQARLALREGELARLREELERARQGATRAGERADEQQRRAEQAEAEGTQLRAELQREAKRRDHAAPAVGASDRDLAQRARDLEDERNGLLAADEALRRQLAHNQSQLRRMTDHVAELESLVPKGRRRKAPPPEPADERRFRLPRFLPSFYKSLEGKDRRSVERAIQALLLFCTEGHAYPGLEVKQLGGQDTWSLRASLGLRVYFRPLADGDIEVLELGDREDQHTTLRRLKDR